MILAAIYPLLVWTLVYRLRRTWPGFALALVGGVTVLLLVPLLRMLMPGAIEAFTILLYAEAVLVALIGVWIATLRRPPSVHTYCVACHYDLSGIDVRSPGAVCPECGDRLSGSWAPQPTINCPTCHADIERDVLSRREARCPHCATVLRGARIGAAPMGERGASRPPADQPGSASLR